MKRRPAEEYRSTKCKKYNLSEKTFSPNHNAKNGYRTERNYLHIGIPHVFQFPYVLLIPLRPIHNFCVCFIWCAWFWR